MSGRRWTAGVLGAAVIAAILGPIGGIASAAPRVEPVPPEGGNGSLQRTDADAGSIDPKYDVVFGMIVRTSSPRVSVSSLSASAESAGADIAVVRPLTKDIRVLTFDAPMTFAEAAPIEAALESRPDVLGVEPDRIVYVADTVIPNDTLFGDQWDMWDGGGSGDFSVRGPQIWGTTTGSPSVVVGVIDTGSTTHPDLAGTTVPGFDFISNANSARDGNQWDSNPADEGTWCTSPARNSNWHGTHVAGTINAIQNNNMGVTGLAPGVKVQHLRALGACGSGSGADILAAVIWGSGGDLGEWFSSFPGQNPGSNPTPAHVLNLSLGGEDTCDAEVSQVIFDQARARGTTVVVAAGNDAVPVERFWPANCQRVVTVTATNRAGGLANYSNFGTSAGQVALSAPGGQGPVNGSGTIWSTMNSGTTTPGSATYSGYQGTSMAAPHVAAAAALLYSMGTTSPSSVEAALKAAVRPFANGGGCTTIACGAGILDASKLAGDTPTGVPGPPRNVTATPGNGQATIAWQPPSSTGGSPITGYSVSVSPGGSACSTDTTSCVVTGLTNGTAYTATVTATNSTGTGLGATSNTFTPSAAQVPGKVRNARVSGYSYGPRQAIATITWRAPSNTGGSAITEYRLRMRAAGGRWSAWQSFSVTTVRATKLRPGQRYSVQIQAGNAIGFGPSVSVALRP